MRCVPLVFLAVFLSCASAPREGVCDFPPMGEVRIRKLGWDILSCAESAEALRSAEHVACMAKYGWSLTPKSSCEMPFRRVERVLLDCVQSISKAKLHPDPIAVCARWLEHEELTIGVETK